MALTEEELLAIVDEVSEEYAELAEKEWLAIEHAMELDEKEIPEVEKIYFDMDSVLADFKGGVETLCGMEAPDINEHNPEKDDEMWKRIREVEHFYAELDEMPGSRPLFETVYKKYRDKVEILTGIPKEKRGVVNAAQDKIDWVRRKFSRDVKVNIVYSEEKKKYCTGKGCILIDDMEKNILEWKAMGGSGFLHIEAENTLYRLQQLGVIDDYEMF